MNFHLLLNRCRCDYRCIFCTMGSEAHRAEQEAILADFDWDAEWQRIDQILATTAQNPTVSALHIMGNDPCNQPDLLRIIERARELGFRRVVLETNGLKLADDRFTCELVDRGVDCFKIPIYGSSASVHDAIVRRPGSFETLEQAFLNLAAHSVEVELHALILKQNAQDLPHCKFPYRLSFRFPFAHERADYGYEHYAPRLSEVPPAVLRRSDLLIPCINGQRARQLPREARARPEAPTERDRDDHVIKVRPERCGLHNCPEYERCEGIYVCYLQSYGEAEFEYRARAQVEAAIATKLDGIRSQLDGLRERARGALYRRTAPWRHRAAERLRRRDRR